MPRIIVVSDVSGSDQQVCLSERVDAANLESSHFRDQLVERLTWAVGDAHGIEVAPASKLAMVRTGSGGAR